MKYVGDVFQIAAYVYFGKVVYDVLKLPIVWTIVVAILILAVAYVLCTLLHESGHLVGGWINGYHLLSFQIGPLKLVREYGEYQLHREKILNHQCVMIPDGSVRHCSAYLMGGVGFSALVGVLACIVDLNMCERGFGYLAVYAIAVCCMCKTVINGLPYFKHHVPQNDCAWFILVHLDPLTNAEYFLYLICYERFANHQTLKDVKKPEVAPGRFYSDIFWTEILKMRKQDQEEKRG